jgi:predicted nucleic acid-binding protein
MSGIFLDSNVLLCLLSANAGKADTAEALLTQAPTISVQVLSEITSVCLHKLKMPWSEITDLLQAVKATCRIVPLTVETHAQAVRVARQHHVSFYDAHIVATAIASGASTLMSEDMHEGLIVQGVRVQNPFATPH